MAYKTKNQRIKEIEKRLTEIAEQLEVKNDKELENEEELLMQELEVLKNTP